MSRALARSGVRRPGPVRTSSLRGRRRPGESGGPGRSGRGGGGEGEGLGGGGTPRWLLPALLVVLLAFGASAAWRWWGGGARQGPDRPRHVTAEGHALRIEVLNGSGEPGAAAKLASYLREGGFNVVQVGSADRYDYARTIVVDRTDQPQPAARVAAYLGEVSRVRQRARGDADVTVVVGRDRGRVPWGEGREPKGRG